MNEQITVQWLTWVADVCKAMKCDYVCITNDLIVGTDKTFSSVVKSGSSNSFFSKFRFGIVNADLQAYVKLIPKGTAYVDINYEKGFIFIEEVGILPFDSLLGDKIMELCGVLEYSMKNSITILRYPELRNDPNFENCLALKSAQGAAMYCKDGYCMSIFSGLLPVNKADKVDLEIYPNDKYFTAVFKITKKKPNIEMYHMFRYLYL